MTRKEKAELVGRILNRHGSLGALVVGDDESLCRLLATFKTDAEDREIGDYLSSFLIA